jgi:hypothetical protein
MKTMILYMVFVTAVIWISWQIQQTHQGWGLTFGLAGGLVAFFWAVNDLTKDRR